MKNSDIQNKVQELHNELKANKGMIPDSWVKWLPIIELFLKAVKIFTPENIDRLIDQILEAIAIFEKKHINS